LRNAALSLLMELETKEVIALALDQYETADNMTDSFAALACLANSSAAQREARSNRSTGAGATKRSSSTNGSRCSRRRAARIRSSACAR
jgi:aminopeptidase N